MVAGSILLVYSALFGLILGSFLNVCIYRIPLGKSIVSPPSSCPSCGERIRFYDNIPVISYLILLGKCRHCGNPVSWQYPIVEALTGLLSLSLFITYGLTYQYILYLLFTASLLTISVIDLHHKIIPDVLSLSGIVLGWIASFVPGSEVSWSDSLIGTLAGGGSLFLVALIYERLTGREGMGGGDIKLLAMIGAWMGWRHLHLVVFLSSLAGAIVGSIFLVLAGKGLRVRIPFGPFLSLGAVLCLFWGPDMMHWYLELIQ
jgi:leader peptidase (prepilin peptidase) / N-methyltransferase